MAKKPELSSKLLVTHRGALRRKYRASGLKAIDSAVKRLVIADRKRGIDTRILNLDSASLGSARVRDVADQTEYKTAIDAVVKKYRPEYLVILGSHDVVPYQDLRNKLHEPADLDSDPDRFVGSDLPYACEHAYSQDVTKFLGPTRVVGRLPDLTGASTPTYLIKLLTESAKARGFDRPDTAFALSARVWQNSTKMSVRNILGSVPSVLTAPTRGPTFSQSLLRQKLHFINCHGDESDHTFMGEGPREEYSKAMDARKLAGVSVGTAAAFECCYGAELYDPQGLPAMSIANTYLAKRAACVLASTTIAYGPADGNSNADVICQLFLEQLLRGASTGRALLEARLAYVRQQSVVDPFDEKTLAQFVLLGDPSTHPFPAAPAPKAKGATAAQAVSHAARLQRRVRLLKAGAQLAQECAYTVAARRGKRPAKATMSKALASARKRFKNLREFHVREQAGRNRSYGKALAKMPKAKQVYVATQRIDRSQATEGVRLKGLIVYQVDGDYVEINLQSR